MKNEILYLIILNFCINLASSFIEPFFPPEAMKKNIGETNIGNIIGIFFLSNLLIMPFISSIRKLASKKMLLIVSVFSEVYKDKK